MLASQLIKGARRRLDVSSYSTNLFYNQTNYIRNIIKSNSYSSETPKLNNQPTRNNVFFEIVHKSKKSNARAGIIHTPHGDILTPSFVPVATNASLKSVDHQFLLQAGTQFT
jgi:hypothetical protein